MQYHQLRILCALRDKIADNDKSLTGHHSIGVQIAGAAEGGSTLCARRVACDTTDIVDQQ
jgi:hypothetical protein